MSLNGTYSATVDLNMFINEDAGSLVAITGADPSLGAWSHQAFVPHPLGTDSPPLRQATYLAVANARASLAALDSTARQLPNPTLLRRPTLRLEAQSTSALEGTYEPVIDVLTADEHPPPRTNMREILNYESMANHAFRVIAEKRPISSRFLCEFQELLVRGTKDEGPDIGRIRQSQVVVGRRRSVAAIEAMPVKAARFVPCPPGLTLESDVRALIDWVRSDHSGLVDPVVAAAMSHYQFETLHPFHDGNGRIGRLLVVLQFYLHDVLSEPTLTISPWFEARRSDYYDHLLFVSCTGDWDAYVRFFANGIQESAALTRRQMLSLVRVQNELRDVVRASNLRADTAHALVDYAVANTSFTVRGVQRDLGVSYGRANVLVQQLQDLGILQTLDSSSPTRRFYAPRVLDVLVQPGGTP